MRNPVKSFSIAVHGAVPLKAKINNGELSSEYDLPKAISEALDFYVTWKKRTGTKPPLKQAAEEIDMFKNDGEQLSDSAKKIVMLIADNIRKTRKMSDGIERAVRAINSENEAKLPGTQEHNRNFVTILDDSFNGLDEPLFQVTNRELSASDKIKVVDITGSPRINALKDSDGGKALIKSLEGKEFSFIGGTGYVSWIDKGALKGENKRSGHEFIHSDLKSKDAITDETRERALTNSEKIFNNCVYVDKHPDYRHQKGTDYIELFCPVKDGNEIYCVHLVARERDNEAGRYKVGKALFYNLYKNKKPLPHGLLENPTNINGGNGLYRITIADMLTGVKDRKGKPYVINGQLNYDDNIFMSKTAMSAEIDRRKFLQNINNFINEKFHGASNISNDGGHISFDMPNGNHIEVNSINNTVYVNPNKKSPNKVQPVYIEDLLTLSKDSINDAISYDALKLAMSTLSNRERKLLNGKFKDIKSIAKAYKAWQVARLNNDGTLLGKTFQRISDTTQNFLNLFAENDKAIISKMKEGKVWESEKNNKSAEKLSNILDKSLEEPLNQMVDISTLKGKAKGKIQEVVKGKDHNNDHITVREREK